MGLCVAINIRRKVVVIDGDGAALMKLGTLATIGAYAPGSLVHLLLDNGVHNSTGGPATVSPHVDFAAVAGSRPFSPPPNPLNGVIARSGATKQPMLPPRPIASPRTSKSQGKCRVLFRLVECRQRWGSQRHFRPNHGSKDFDSRHSRSWTDWTTRRRWAESGRAALGRP
jgi:hypothetical protein